MESGVKFREKLNFDERIFFLELMPTLAGENLVFYDIGAHIGTVSSCVLKVPSVAHVYAFEPLSSVFNILQERLKKYPHVSCFNIALGSENAEAEIFVNYCLPSSSMYKMLPAHKEEFPQSEESIPEKINVVSLDDFVDEKRLKPPDVIKIDVQGSENQVLSGGADTIQKSKYCVIEMSLVTLYENCPLFNDIYKLMDSLGFKLIGFAGEVHGESGRQLQVDGIFENIRIKTGFDSVE